MSRLAGIDKKPVDLLEQLRKANIRVNYTLLRRRFHQLLEIHQVPLESISPVHQVVKESMIDNKEILGKIE